MGDELKELKRELGETFERLGALEAALEKDKKLREITGGLGATDLDKLVIPVAAAKILTALAKYFKVPPEAVELKKGEPR